jgi:lipopolysaccharide biosynthesis glycosyltransferase
MLHSLFVRQRRPVEVHLLAAADVTPELAGRLSAWVDEMGGQLTMHRVADDDPRLGGVTHTFSLATWFRLLLPQALPELDRVLYIDSDTIVMDSLDPLLRLELAGNCVAAVTVPPITLEWMERHSAALGLPSTDDYWNAGVMVMDLRALRAGGWMERLIAYARAHHDHTRAAEVDENSPRDVFRYTMRHPERLLFPDQDVLNAVLNGHRLRLHPRWNLQTLFRRSDVRTPELTEQRVAEAWANPAIRHFEGPGHSKPWHPDAEPEDSALYWAHRNQTPWAT